MSTSPSDGRGQTGEPSSPEQPTPSSTELVVASAGIDEQNGPTAEGIPMQVKGPKRRGSVEAGPQDDSPSKQITGGAPKPSPYGQQGTGPLSVMHPQTPRRQIWEAFTLVLVIYCAVQVPFVIGFDVENDVLNGLDWFVDGVFFVDILLCFNTAYYKLVNNRSQIVWDRKDISMHYLRTWFFFDLISVLPIDKMVGDDGSKDGVQTYLPLFKLVRLLRIRRLLLLLDRLKGAVLLRVMVLFMAMAYSAHLCGCMFAFINKIEQRVGADGDVETIDCVDPGAEDCGVRLNWYQEVGWAEFSNIRVDSQGNNKADFKWANQKFYIYLGTVWTCLVLMLGEDIGPNSESEQIFCIMMVLLGLLLTSVIFSNMVALVEEFSRGSNEYSAKMGMVKSAVDKIQVPDVVKQKVFDHYQFMMERFGTVDMLFDRFLLDLPDDLHRQIKWCVHGDLLKQSPFFQGTDEGFQKMLAMRLCFRPVPAETLVTGRGDMCKAMFYVREGELKQTDDDEGGKETKIESGAVFGEMVLVGYSCKHATTVTTVTPCELYTVMLTDVQELAKFYPEDCLVMKDHALDKMFANMDRSGDGSVSFKEMVEFIKKVGMPFAEGQYDQLMSQLDVGGDGQVSKEEFLNFFSERRKQMQKGGHGVRVANHSGSTSGTTGGATSGAPQATAVLGGSSQERMLATAGEMTERIGQLEDVVQERIDSLEKSVGHRLSRMEDEMKGALERLTSAVTANRTQYDFTAQLRAPLEPVRSPSSSPPTTLPNGHGPHVYSEPTSGTDTQTPAVKAPWAELQDLN